MVILYSMGRQPDKQKSETGTLIYVLKNLVVAVVGPKGEKEIALAPLSIDVSSVAGILPVLSIKCCLP